MSGEKDLKVLLSNLMPRLLPDTYVFCIIEGGSYGNLGEANPIASFQETEGLSLILSKTDADKHRLKYEGEYKGISLDVHSSLEAVGMTAAIATKLTAHNISANIIAAFHHDHLFIPSKDAEKALDLLRDI